MDTQRLDRIENKLDKIVDIQTEIQLDVAEHIRRTEIAETNIVKLAETLAPIQAHVAAIQGIGKIVAILASIASAIAAFLALK